MPCAFFPLTALSWPHLLHPFSCHGVHMQVLPNKHRTRPLLILALQLQPTRDPLIVGHFGAFSLHQSAVALWGYSWGGIAAMVELVNVALSVEVDAWVKAVIHVLIDQVRVGLVVIMVRVCRLEFAMHACVDSRPAHHLVAFHFFFDSWKACLFTFQHRTIPLGRFMFKHSFLLTKN